MEAKAKIFTHLEPGDEDGPKNGRDICPYAAQFLQWADQLCADYRDSPVKIAQAKVLLVDKYDEWRNSVPKSHRHHAGERGHFCIYHVAFNHAYRILRLAELAQTGPMLFLPPPPPPPPPPPQIAGIFIGEDLGGV